MSDSSDQCGRVFRYLTIGMEPLIFGIVGYFVGPYVFGSDIMGALVGALVGTLMMFLTLFYLAGLFERKKPGEPEGEREE